MRLREIINKIRAHRKGRASMELEYLINAGMKVGKNCHIYSTSTIDSLWPWLIMIGDNVTISSNVAILAHDASTNIVGCETKLGRCNIGSNVFIAAGSIILCNVNIGSIVIVGAGSVVSKDLPDNGVYAGNPAERICSIDEYREKYSALRKERPDFSKVHPWTEWRSASDEEKQMMKDKLKDGIGFV